MTRSSSKQKLSMRNPGLVNRETSHDLLSPDWSQVILQDGNLRLLTFYEALSINTPLAEQKLLTHNVYLYPDVS